MGIFVSPLLCVCSLGDKQVPHLPALVLLAPICFHKVPVVAATQDPNDGHKM